MNEVKFPAVAHKRVITGKIMIVRKDNFPMLLNTSTDIARDIQTLQGEGVLEISHFVMQEEPKNSTMKIKVGLEYNHYGPKIGELRYYIEALGQRLKLVRNVAYVPLTTNQIKTFPKRMGNISEIVVRVHRDETDKIKDVEKGLFESIENVKKHFDQEYVTLSLKYDIRQIRKNPTLSRGAVPRNFVQKILDNFLHKPNHALLFDEFTVLAEDSDKNNRLHAFDLLINKVKDSFEVEVRPLNRTIISEIMFTKMLDAWNRLKIKL